MSKDPIIRGGVNTSISFSAPFVSLKLTFTYFLLTNIRLCYQNKTSLAWSSSFPKQYLSLRHDSRFSYSFSSLTCASLLSGWFFQTFLFIRIPNKQFPTSKTAWWVIKILGQSFFCIYIFYFQSRNKTRKASPWLCVRLAFILMCVRVNEITSHAPMDCCFTSYPSKFVPCTQKKPCAKFRAFSHSVTISPKNRNKPLH